MPNGIVQWSRERVPPAIVVQRVCEVFANEPRLSYRKPKEIRRLLRTGSLWTSEVDGELGCFLFVTPLSRPTVELHSLYTFPKYRGRGQARRLLHFVLTQQHSRVISVTFQHSVAQLLCAEGFNLSGLGELTILERVNFLRQRLHWHRLKSIARALKVSTPQYFIRPW